MPDFIFSTKKRQEGVLANALKSIYEGYTNSINEIHSEFYSLAFVKNHYNGFSMYQDNSSICLVIGGPVLNFRDNNFIANENSNEGTKSIFERWIINNEISWDTDLSGPFVIFYLSKLTGVIKLVTDMMSFIPVYTNNDDNLLIGTHIDSLNIIESSELDKVSIADFILHEVVTFPHTFWKKYIQLHSGSIYKWLYNKNKIEFNCENYWLPKEPVKSDFEIKELALELRNGLKDYVSNVSMSANKKASFISGGEDSRSIISLIQHEKDAFIFLDNENKESVIAREVCSKFNANIILKIRDKNYYLHILEKASKLIGSGFDYAHVHTIGFVETCDMRKYDAIFGGFLADTFLKGHHIKKKPRSKLFRFLPLPSKIDYSDISSKRNSNIFIPEIIEEVNKRRDIHLSLVQKLRPTSYREWVNVYPITMHNDIPNILGNRRLFRSFEPFTDSTVLKIASKATQDQKLDRKLFHLAIKPIYKKTKWVRHSNGSYPFLPWYLNNLFIYQQSLKRGIINIIKKNQPNEGSWTNWDKIINTDNAISLEEKYYPILKNKIGKLFKNNLRNGILNENSINVREKRILLQIGYVLYKGEEGNENT